MPVTNYIGARSFVPESGFATFFKKTAGVYPLGSNTVAQEETGNKIIKNPKVPGSSKSFMNHVPMHLYDNGTNQVVCFDGETRGVFLELFPADTEARPENILESIAEKITIALQTIPATDPAWVLQVYLQDEPVESFVDDIEKYASKRTDDNNFTKEWIKVLDGHLRLISSEKGIFHDEKTETHWQAKFRRIRAVIYRKPSKKFAPNDLSMASKRLMAALREAGIKSKIMQGEDIYHWLYPWYSGKGVGGYEHMKKFPYPTQDEELPADFDLGEMCTGFPTIDSDMEKQAFKVNGRLQRFITLKPIQAKPRIGLWTKETPGGASPFDRLPSGTILSFTMTTEPIDKNTTRIESIGESAIGTGQEAVSTAKECEKALELIVEGNRLVRWLSGIYVFADSQEELLDKTTLVTAAAGAAYFDTFDVDEDNLAIDSYLRSLPMNFDPDMDKKVQKRARMAWGSHAARMLPLYGGGVGTGHPGAVFYSRVGQPMTFDPLNPKDKSKNSHMLILGPTGSGKTATVNYMLLNQMAMSRPKLFLITALPTFGLLGQYFKKNGMSVNHVYFQPENDISVPPFADITQIISNKNLGDRDVLGEAEIAARLMITGGEQKEEDRLGREEKSLIQTAIITAAQAVFDEGRKQALVLDVVNAFRMMSRSDNYHQKDKLLSMDTSMEKFTHGLEGHFFNREGKTWPDVDVTIVELGILARQGYEDKLAIAMAGLMSRINNVVEAGQYTRRPTITVIDEAHLLIKNPLVGPYINSISAMWRTFGGWLWIVTQNLHQIPDSSKQLLNQPEWWVLLSTDKDEVEQIARFKSLSEEQKILLQAARKEPGKFTEGVVMSKKLLQLFRNVPPGLALALAQTEQDEKAARMAIAKERGISEFEAALVIGEMIDAKRAAYVGENI